jgi:hypothetical protein
VSASDTVLYPPNSTALVPSDAIAWPFRTAGGVVTVTWVHVVPSKVHVSFSEAAPP